MISHYIHPDHFQPIAFIRSRGLIAQNRSRGGLETAQGPTQREPGKRKRVKTDLRLGDRSTNHRRPPADATFCNVIHLRAFLSQLSSDIFSAFDFFFVFRIASPNSNELNTLSRNAVFRNPTPLFFSVHHIFLHFLDDLRSFVQFLRYFFIAELVAFHRYAAHGWSRLHSGEL